MSKTDGRRSAQGGRTKPSYEIRPVPADEVKPGQSDKDLGARWGAGSKTGPRKTRGRPASPGVLGGFGLGNAPEEPESRRESLDQPNLGSDRPNRTLPFFCSPTCYFVGLLGLQ